MKEYESLVVRVTTFTSSPVSRCRSFNWELRSENWEPIYSHFGPPPKIFLFPPADTLDPTGYNCFGHSPSSGAPSGRRNCLCTRWCPTLLACSWREGGAFRWASGSFSSRLVAAVQAAADAHPRPRLGPVPFSSFTSSLRARCLPLLTFRLLPVL